MSRISLGTGTQARELLLHVGNGQSLEPTKTAPTSDITIQTSFDTESERLEHLHRPSPSSLHEYIHPIAASTDSLHLVILATQTSRPTSLDLDLVQSALARGRSSTHPCSSDAPLVISFYLGPSSLGGQYAI